MEALETTRREVRWRARTLCGAGGKSAVVEWVMHVHLNYRECLIWKTRDAIFEKINYEVK